MNKKDWKEFDKKTLEEKIQFATSEQTPEKVLLELLNRNEPLEVQVQAILNINLTMEKIEEWAHKLIENAVEGNYVRLPISPLTERNCSEALIRVLNGIDDMAVLRMQFEWDLTQYELTQKELIAKLANSQYWEIRSGAAGHINADEETISKLMKDDEFHVLQALIFNRNLHNRDLEKLAKHKNVEVANLAKIRMQQIRDGQDSSFDEIFKQMIKDHKAMLKWTNGHIESLEAKITELTNQENPDYYEIDVLTKDKLWFESVKKSHTNGIQVANESIEVAKTWKKKY